MTSDPRLWAVDGEVTNPLCAPVRPFSGAVALYDRRE